MAKVIEINEVEWKKWVESRPEAVQQLCKKLPPDRLYLLKTSNHRVTLFSYSEDGTVTVNVTGKYNALTFERQVFGIKPEDLEECDLPDPNEPLGALLTEPDEIEAHIALLRETR